MFRPRGRIVRVRDLHLYCRFPRGFVGEHCVREGSSAIMAGRLVGETIPGSAGIAGLQQAPIQFHPASYSGYGYALFFERGGEWFVRQLGSKVPLFRHRLGADPVRSIEEDVPLAPGDRLQFGESEGTIEVEDRPSQVALVIPGARPSRHVGPFPLGRSGIRLSDDRLEEFDEARVTQSLRVMPGAITATTHDDTDLRNGAEITIAGGIGRIFSRPDAMSGLSPRAVKVIELLENENPNVGAQAIELALSTGLVDELLDDGAVTFPGRVLFRGDRARDPFLWATTLWRAHQRGASSLMFEGAPTRYPFGVPDHPRLAVHSIPASVSEVSLSRVTSIAGVAGRVHDVTLVQCGRDVLRAFPNVRCLRLDGISSRSGLEGPLRDRALQHTRRNRYDVSGLEHLERLEVRDAYVKLAKCPARELRWDADVAIGLSTAGMALLERLEMPSFVKGALGWSSAFAAPSLRVVAAPFRPRELPGSVRFERLGMA